jgi:hypothetical protein
MDFAGVLAMCEPMLPLIQHSVPQTAPMKCLFMMGSAEIGLQHHDRALEHLLAAQAIMDRSAVAFTWLWRMPLESALTELWLAQGDLARARPQAEKFLKIALASAEHTWQALAWEVNARIAMAERDLTAARLCVAKALLATRGFEVPLARWRVHATAAELYQRTGAKGLSKRHLSRSRQTIWKLANSLLADDPLRQTFLAAPVIRKILLDAHHEAADALAIERR